MTSLTDARLTTHVLDTTKGRPGAGIDLVLTRDGVEVARATTNADGRTDAPLLAGADFAAGTYEVTFSIGAYFQDPDGFLDEVPVRFTIAAPTHVHLALLCTPWSYTTYRGS